MTEPIDNGAASPPEEPWRWRVVIEMNERLGCRVGSNCPSVDVTEMVLYRALRAIERDLVALRLRQEADRVPRVTAATHFPRGMA